MNIKIAIASIAAAFCAATSFGFGNFLNKVSSEAESAQASATKESEVLAEKLSKACSSFLQAKSKAHEAAGNSQEAAKFASLSGDILTEKSLQVLDKYLNDLGNQSILDIVKDSTIKTETSKSAIAESLEFFVNGINEETELSKEAYQQAKKSKDALLNAGISEKANAMANMQALTKLSERLPQDIANAKETLKLYMEFAKKNGVDISELSRKILNK